VTYGSQLLKKCLGLLSYFTGRSRTLLLSFSQPSRELGISFKLGSERLLCFLCGGSMRFH